MAATPGEVVMSRGPSERRSKLLLCIKRISKHSHRAATATNDYPRFNVQLLLLTDRRCFVVALVSGLGRVRMVGLHVSELGGEERTLE